MKKIVIIVLSSLALVSCAWFSGSGSDGNKTTIDISSKRGLNSAKKIRSETDLSGDLDRLSYALGAYFGTQLALFEQLEFPIFLAGLQHAYNEEDEVVLNQQQISQAIIAAQQQVLQRTSQQSLKEGQDFLTANAEKEGVTSLDNGLQYRVLTEGKGKKPKAEDTVVVHYEGSLTNGQVFDSSYQRNETAVFPLEGVIVGWQEILPLMPTGSVWEVVIPPHLGYGEQGSGRAIGPNAVLVFKIELVDIVDE